MVASELLEEAISIWHAHRHGLLVLISIIIIVLRLVVFKPRPQAHENVINDTPDPKAASRTEVTHYHEKPPLIAPPSNLRVVDNGPRPGLRSGPKRISGKRFSPDKIANEHTVSVRPVIFYFSVGGSTRARAEELAQSFSTSSQTVACHDLAEIDHDDFFITVPETKAGTSLLYLLLIPSYDIDTELANFLANLAEIHHDFRIDTGPLAQLAGYSVLGFGDSQDWPTEREGFCSQAIEVDQWMSKLTAGRRAFPLGLVDVKKTGVSARIDEWHRGVEDIMRDLAQGKGLGEGVSGSGDPYESGDEIEEDDGIETAPRPSKTSKVTTDLEDIRAPPPVDFTTTASAPKAMVPVASPTYNSLTKQGYSIVGSHSGVKICRWTKSALRGRGSCYKYSFYGIASHRCMEATPSLSCSNKCVFCWRHGTNPVGTTWRWQVDQPDLIFDGIKKEHYRKIKMLRGVPGVRAERFEEGMRIRHCALSLVGEPIFYPFINELLAMLHKEHISSFLVCNAQHPDQLATLGPVTQLYVSIDASNKESLRRIDRPLHRDYWERFIRCMDILRAKRNTHRTVFRLTLVKGFNIEEEAEGYADLVERALPSFIEVKGVTYCGTSTAAGAGLTMQNVPFYEEVTAFVLALEAALLKRGLDYGIGAEHAHSCCILLADKKRYFKVPKDAQDNVKRWHTLIDYPSFFSLLESGKPFGPEDYIGSPTAEWALWGNGGFDPRDERVDRKGRAIV
ncbi:hypothetical protein AMS68_004559 [Peltaster fructicola]|uniref:tRNA 4-demethylwyosine synthase (AdoMet-dependent) n=1 Tax=Peltaster fructicola TaxID=286661 RepID=A0A6H0XW98_9PEZI|nr:hypothetical protein AMS68_004559 [Peltaster fructicola]